MTLEMAKHYVTKYRAYQNGCYVHIDNRETFHFETNFGEIIFRCHAQSKNYGRSKTKFCAYLTFAKTGKAVLTRNFVKIVEVKNV